MEAVYFGCNDLAPLPNGSMPECRTGPYVMADLERMHGMMNKSLPPTYLDPVPEFVVAMVKGEAGHMAIKVGDGQRGASLRSVYDGPRPPGYERMHKEGAIVLGIGGDNSPWGDGTWFEGVMTKGYTSEATDAAAMANVVAAAYSRYA